MDSVCCAPPRLKPKLGVSEIDEIDEPKVEGWRAIRVAVECKRQMKHLNELKKKRSRKNTILIIRTFELYISIHKLLLFCFTYTYTYIYIPRYVQCDIYKKYHLVQ